MYNMRWNGETDIRTLKGTLSLDELIATNDQFTLCDHLGSVRDIVNADGKVTGHREYNAFGKVTRATGKFDCIFGYTGKMLDTAVGLQWNINRWYDAEVGRWISEDTKGFKGKDANLTRYVFGNSISMLDYNGNEGTAAAIGVACYAALPHLWKVVEVIGTLATFAGLAGLLVPSGSSTVYEPGSPQTLHFPFKFSEGTLPIAERYTSVYGGRSFCPASVHFELEASVHETDLINFTNPVMLSFSQNLSLGFGSRNCCENLSLKVISGATFTIECRKDFWGILPQRCFKIRLLGGGAPVRKM